MLITQASPATLAIILTLLPSKCVKLLNNKKIGLLSPNPNIFHGRKLQENRHDRFHLFLHLFLLSIFILFGLFLVFGCLALDEVTVLADQFLYFAINVLILGGEFDILLKIIVVEGLVILSIVITMAICTYASLFQMIYVITPTLIFYECP